jgi:oligoendopeptidase F
MRLFLLSAALLLVPSIAVAQDGPDDWDLSDLYPSLEAWEAAKTDVSAKAEAFKGCEGRITKSSKDLAGCLDAYFELDKQAGRVWVWAASGADTDNRDAAANARRGDSAAMWGELGSATSFVEAALVSAGSRKLDKWVARDPALADYAFFIAGVLRKAEHTLDADGEALIAAAGPVMGASFEVFNMLTTADIVWPEITLEDGTVVRIDKAGYGKWRANPDRAVREEVFAAFYETIGGFERTLGAALHTHLLADKFGAETRNYKSTLEAALFVDGIPVEVYTTLVEQVSANLPTLHRYLRLRGAMLGVTDLRYIDIYPPMVDLDLEFPLELGKQLALDSSVPLGDDYVAVTRKGFEERWMDAYPKDGKSPGAYCTGAYDVHPYVLMNYQDDYESVSTLAHEWGHAMHSYLASEAQPYASASYDTFMAEVASTFNEALLLDHMLGKAQGDEERMYYLGAALEALRGTYFRQTMFAEFELAIHERVEGGEAMTGERLSEMYLALLRRYHGHDEGVMQIDEAYASEWAWIPHFYFNYYVFQYATSTAASSLLADRVIQGEEGAVETYLGLLRAGGSGHSYELLKDAGVDLATPAPYEATIVRMNAIMDEMERLRARMEPVPQAAPEGEE